MKNQIKLKLLIPLAYLFAVMMTGSGCAQKKVWGYLYVTKQFDPTLENTFRDRLAEIQKHTKNVQISYDPTPDTQGMTTYSVVYYSKFFPLIPTHNSELFYSIGSRNMNATRSGTNLQQSFIKKILFDDVKTYSATDVNDLASQINTDMGSAASGIHTVKVIITDAFSWIFAYQLTLLNQLANPDNIKVAMVYDPVEKAVTVTYFIPK